MEISILGILLIVFTLLFFVYKFGLQKKSIEEGYNSFFLFSIVFALLIDVGFIFSTDSFVFEYTYYFSIVCFFLALLVLFKRKMSPYFITPIVIFVFYLLTITIVPYLMHTTYMSAEHGVVWDVYFGPNGEKMAEAGVTFDSFFIIARTFIFLVCFYALTITLKKDNFYGWMKVLYKASWVVIVLSLVEIVISNISSPTLFREIVTDIFGHSKATYPMSKSFKGFYPPMLFSREPSTYVLSLFIFGTNNIAYYFFHSEKRRLSTLVNLLFIVLFSLSSFSMSAVIYLAIMFLIVIYILGINKGWLPLLIAVIAIPILLVLFKDRIANLLDTLSYFIYSNPSELPESSEIIRLYSIYNNLKYFIQNPLFGTGVGVIYCFSSVVTLIANIGLIGLAMFVLIISRFTNKILNSQIVSFFTIFVFIGSFTLTGHMSLILYIDKIIVMYLVCKDINLCVLSKKPSLASNKEVLGNAL